MRKFAVTLLERYLIDFDRGICLEFIQRYLLYIFFILALEAMDVEDLVPSPHDQTRLKQTVQMLLRDLSTVRKLAALC